MNRKSHPKTVKPTHKQKGTLLEQVVASLHDAQDAWVQTNVRLPTTDNPKRKREIDVLLTASVAGYPVRFAIECKNHDKVIGAKEIDAFIGKLQDVGISCQQGIFVAKDGYTKGAVDRGRKAGLRLLRIHGLTRDGLNSVLRQAVQSVLYVLPLLSKVTVENDYANATIVEDFAFFDEAGTFVATIPDLAWQAWLDGAVPTELGTHTIKLIAPDSWYNIYDNEKVRPKPITAEILVRGCVIKLYGTATEHVLLQSPDDQFEKYQSKVVFDASQTVYPVTAFDSEDEWQTYWDAQPQPMKLAIGRIKVPRLKWGHMFWPPSLRVRAALDEYFRDNGYTQMNPEKLSAFIAEVEGTDLSAAWDEI